MTSTQASDVLADVSAGLRSVLELQLVAVYVYGSVVVGGFDEASDIDLLVVVRGDLDRTKVSQLDALHRRVVESHPEFDDRLELVYVARETLARFREGGRLWVISPGEPFHERDGVDLWLSNFYLVRESGVSIFGPAPAEVVPVISWAEFRAAIHDYAEQQAARDIRAAHPAGRAYILLTLCRALATLEADRPHSKREGAAYVRSAMPEWAWLIDEAERCRLSRGKAGLTDEATISSASEFVAQVRELFAGAATELR